jgi:hypothetical protein
MIPKLDHLAFLVLPTQQPRPSQLPCQSHKIKQCQVDKDLGLPNWLPTIVAAGSNFGTRLNSCSNALKAAMHLTQTKKSLVIGYLLNWCPVSDFPDQKTNFDFPT